MRGGIAPLPILHHGVVYVFMSRYLMMHRDSFTFTNDRRTWAHSTVNTLIFYMCKFHVSDERPPLKTLPTIRITWPYTVSYFDSVSGYLIMLHNVEWDEMKGRFWIARLISWHYSSIIPETLRKATRTSNRAQSNPAQIRTTHLLSQEL
jgi:hypothetical protein